MFYVCFSTSLSLSFSLFPSLSHSLFLFPLSPLRKLRRVCRIFAERSPTWLVLVLLLPPGAPHSRSADIKSAGKKAKQEREREIQREDDFGARGRGGSSLQVGASAAGPQRVTPWLADTPETSLGG